MRRLAWTPLLWALALPCLSEAAEAPASGGRRRRRVALAPYTVVGSRHSGGKDPPAAAKAKARKRKLSASVAPRLHSTKAVGREVVPHVGGSTPSGTPREPATNLVSGVGRLVLPTLAEVAVTQEAMQEATHGTDDNISGAILLPVYLQVLLHNSTVEGIHEGAFGPLSRFVLAFRGALCGAANVTDRRLGPLGIHGRFKQPGGSAARILRIVGVTGPAVASQRTAQEVVIDITVLPGAPGAKSPKEVAESLRGELDSNHSELRAGVFAPLLLGAEVSKATSDPVSPAESSARWGQSAALVRWAGAALLAAAWAL